MSRFDDCIAFCLAWEGGYSFDKDDPGGETNFGISKKAHPEVDIKNLTLEGAKAIYERDYWKATGADKLPPPLDLIHLDAAINVGPGRAGGFLKTGNHVPAKVIDARDAYYHRLASQKPVLQKYLKGWLNRTKALRKFAGL